MTIKNLIGKTVKVITGNGLMSEMFIGSDGKVIGACPLYRGAVIVKFDNGYVVSYYPKELKVLY